MDFIVNISFCKSVFLDFLDYICKLYVFTAMRFPFLGGCITQCRSDSSTAIKSKNLIITNN
jgi:hypothetical protein